jgi:hypothetical protein
MGRYLTIGEEEKHNVKMGYRKIKRPFPPPASSHPLPHCSRLCPRLASAPPPLHTPCQSVARGTPCQRIEKGPITSTWFPAGLVLELENILGQRIDIVTETALNPYLRDHVRREAVPL